MLKHFPRNRYSALVKYYQYKKWSKYIDWKKKFTVHFRTSRAMDDDPRTISTSQHHNQQQQQQQQQQQESSKNRLRIKPMSLMTGTVTSQVAKQNIREVSCVAVPFFKAPGSNSLKMEYSWPSLFALFSGLFEVKYHKRKCSSWTLSLVGIIFIKKLFHRQYSNPLLLRQWLETFLSSLKIRLYGYIVRMKVVKNPNYRWTVHAKRGISEF